MKSYTMSPTRLIGGRAYYGTGPGDWEANLSLVDFSTGEVLDAWLLGASEKTPSPSYSRVLKTAKRVARAA